MIIYKTTNTINGKIYIGKSIRNNENYLGSGLLLNKAIKKYGKDKFIRETIDEAASVEELNAKEIYWIDKLNSTKNNIGYNIAKGGTGGDTLSNHPNCAEIRKKAQETMRKVVKTQEYIKKRSVASKKNWLNSEYKKNMENILKGRKITWKDKIRDSVNAYYAKHGPRKVSEETKQKIKNNRKNLPFKSVSENIEKRILELYTDYGAVRISEILFKETAQIISRYLIVKILKQKGIYQKNCKGLKFLKNRK